MGTEKGIFDHGMKGMLPAHPLSPATLKESTIRAQLWLFKNKTEEEEEKDEENCRLLLKAGVEGEGVGSLRAGGHSRGCCLGEMRRLCQSWACIRDMGTGLSDRSVEIGFCHTPAVRGLSPPCSCS